MVIGLRTLNWPLKVRKGSCVVGPKDSRVVKISAVLSSN